ncbi:MAG: hypothetical protein RL514_1382 [Verrucomicrobiota bacterium]|jgi:hypothetical protein
MLDLLISESPSPKQVEDSLHGFVHRVERFLHRLGVSNVGVDEERLVAAHRLSMALLHHYINPSCFKAAAALTMGVSATRPFEVDLPPTSFKSLADYPNAVFPILESVYWMHGAELLVAPDDVRTLDDPIEFSDHFFREFVISCGRLGTMTPDDVRTISDHDRTKLRILALNYEALAYQNNGHCKYPPPVDLHLDKYFNILT